MFNFLNTYSSLPSLFFMKASPTIVNDPKLLLFNYNLARDLDLNFDSMSELELAEIFSGNKELNQSQPIAQAYAGHQFGHFTMLGDGRAILLGEHLTKDNKLYDVQLKGAGETAYSRRGDGRAAVGPMLREYIISEAMHFLGIPTTRSLAVIATGEEVFRIEKLDGAILTRIAQSHIRVGTFEYARAKNDLEALKVFTDYVIERHYQELNDLETKYVDFLSSVIERQAELITKWLSVGFIHGVMNTDNMAISGETIDYGPCAFMDQYDPMTVFSSIDRDGRYAYGNQANIAKWNLARFAETLLPLLNPDPEISMAIAEDLVSDFDNKFEKYWLKSLGSKLGIDNLESKDLDFCNELFKIMLNQKLDYTEFFVALTYSQEKIVGNDLQDWLKKLSERRNKNNISKEDSINLMKKANPIIIPRNHIVEEALFDAVNNNLGKVNELLEILSNPYDQNRIDSYYAKPPSMVQKNYRTFCGT